MKAEELKIGNILRFADIGRSLDASPISIAAKVTDICIMRTIVLVELDGVRHNLLLAVGEDVEVSP